MIIKTPKFEETEGDCGQTVKYGTGKGTFTAVKKLLGRTFFRALLLVMKEGSSLF